MTATTGHLPLLTESYRTSYRTPGPPRNGGRASTPVPAPRLGYGADLEGSALPSALGPALGQRHTVAARVVAPRIPSLGAMCLTSQFRCAETTNGPLKIAKSALGPPGHAATRKPSTKTPCPAHMRSAPMPTGPVERCPRREPRRRR
jgi:hypothetical protein